MKPIKKLILGLGTAYALLHGCGDSTYIKPEGWVDTNNDGKQEIVYTIKYRDDRIPSHLVAEDVYAADTTGSSWKYGELLVPNKNRTEHLGVIDYPVSMGRPEQKDRIIFAQNTEGGLETVARWPVCDDCGGLVNEVKAKN